MADLTLVIKKAVKDIHVFMDEKRVVISQEDKEHLAKSFFAHINSDKDWNSLNEKVKNFWVTLASYAIQEKRKKE